MKAEIRTGSMQDRQEVIRTGPLPPELEKGGVIVLVSQRQWSHIVLGSGENIVSVSPTEPSLEERRQQFATARALSDLFGETRETRMNEALLPFQREKVRKAVELKKTVVFRIRIKQGQ